MTTRIAFLLALACLAPIAAAETLTIHSGDLSVACDVGTHELTFSRDGKPFAEHVKWWDALGDAPAAKSINVRDALGDGQGIQLTSPAGAETFWLAGTTPFVLARVSVHNAGAAPLIVKDLVPCSVPLAGTDADTRFFSPEGITRPSDSTAYFFLAAVEPATRAGVVAGWLTHDVGSGVIGSFAGANNAVTIAPRGEYGKHAVAPGATLNGETVAIGDFPDARLGLEALADANARENNIHLRPAMSGYCTWYHAHASNEHDLKTLADFAKSQNLHDYGFDFLQIDDGWQTARRDFSTYSTAPKATYPSGMKATADGLISDGFIAGIWLTPFAWDAKILADHLDYFVKTPEGKPYSVKWAGDCLDMTNPAARAYLSDTIHRITHDWHYKYLKIDGLWSGMATTILYPSPIYKPDDYGNAVFHDPSATNLSAYRTGLRTVRQAAGDDVFICGCNVAQNHRTLGGSIGLLDAMRVGPDIKATWDSIAGRAAVYAAREYFLNGRVWWNDPDCLMLRDPITLDEARAWGSFIAISGQLNVVSEDLAKLPADKLDIVKRTMPNVPHLARPLDLFTENQPTIWQADIGQGEAAHQIVGLFNWDDKNPSKITLDPKALNLPAGDYLAFDYWNNQFLAPLTAARDIDLSPGSCCVLSLVKDQRRPQLISTSRHVLQGGPDIVEVSWNAATNTLSGKSKVIANDPYELRIATGPYAVLPQTAMKCVQEGDHLRATLTSPTTREISWNFTFTPRK